MPRRSLELLYAFVAMVVIGLLYLAAITRLGSIPAAGDLLGHGLGIAGLVLMLMTETLYSLRKRSRRARWGRMSTWLRFHIFTGLVGPFMVLLHTSWKFNGLAGLVTLFTVLIVLSGFVGRYIYTAVPRTAEGLEVSAADLEHQIAAVEADLQRRLAEGPESERALVQHLAGTSDLPQDGPLLVLGRTFLEWGYRLKSRQQRRGWSAATRRQARELTGLLRQRRALRRQVASLVTARRLLATWHAVHIPLGVVLFVAAFVHVGAALYYATLLR